MIAISTSESLRGLPLFLPIIKKGHIQEVILPLSVRDLYQMRIDHSQTLTLAMILENLVHQDAIIVLDLVLILGLCRAPFLVPVPGLALLLLLFH